MVDGMLFAAFVRGDDEALAALPKRMDYDKIIPLADQYYETDETGNLVNGNEARKARDIAWGTQWNCWDAADRIPISDGSGYVYLFKGTQCPHRLFKSMRSDMTSLTTDARWPGFKYRYDVKAVFVGEDDSVWKYPLDGGWGTSWKCVTHYGKPGVWFKIDDSARLRVRQLYYEQGEIRFPVEATYGKLEYDRYIGGDSWDGLNLKPEWMLAYLKTMDKKSAKALAGKLRKAMAEHGDDWVAIYKAIGFDDYYNTSGREPLPCWCLRPLFEIEVEGKSYTFDAYADVDESDDSVSYPAFDESGYSVHARDPLFQLPAPGEDTEENGEDTDAEKYEECDQCGLVFDDGVEINYCEDCNKRLCEDCTYRCWDCGGTYCFDCMWDDDLGLCNHCKGAVE